VGFSGNARGLSAPQRLRGRHETLGFSAFDSPHDPNDFGGLA
jgi:hypothetical protein